MAVPLPTTSPVYTAESLDRQPVMYVSTGAGGTTQRQVIRARDVEEEKVYNLQDFES